MTKINVQGIFNFYAGTKGLKKRIVKVRLKKNKIFILAELDEFFMELSTLEVDKKENVSKKYTYRTITFSDGQSFSGGDADDFEIQETDKCERFLYRINGSWCLDEL